MPRVDHVDALRFAQTFQLSCAASILQPRLQLGQRTELQAPRRVALFGVQGIERGEGGLEITGRVQGPHLHPQLVTPLARERAGRGQRDGGIGVHTCGVGASIRERQVGHAHQGDRRAGGIVVALGVGERLQPRGCIIGAAERHQFGLDAPCQRRIRRGPAGGQRRLELQTRLIRRSRRSRFVARL